jgi:hypothetical protein
MYSRKLYSANVGGRSGNIDDQIGIHIDPTGSSRDYVSGTQNQSHQLLVKRIPSSGLEKKTHSCRS